MPGYFKKRRTHGPSKNEEKVARARTAESRPPLRSRFPQIKQLKVHFSFSDAQGHPLGEENLAFGPADAVLFVVPCPGRCGRGSFDFGPKIAETAGARLAASESGATCPEALYAGAAETCGCAVKCRMELEYLPAPVGD